ncbi:TrkH family potassium uptake protein [Campylobacter sp. MIT 97-5078]|uniref:TrkH family potassium uptake protein n=1 Tax=Campylobacter sp. MIT 97-5078 TaxID=1548153 RepID=UPI000512D989|nr:TrkH family potassium uptake protein [Campylobacter sp. MIT 97-5078]KGI57366.1 potassium transporter [Campylobacter sp. MIT 97-5078]TQR27454.1 potassium transporter [Campylobacter sp. MIT 97-5078]
MKQTHFDRKTVRFLFFGYIIIAFLGAFLLSIGGVAKEKLSFIDALFTSVSAISMTGLIVKNIALDFNLSGQIIILFLIQIGGLGYMGLGVFFYVLIRKKIGFHERNMLKESLLYPHMEGVVDFLRKILFFVFIAEFIGGILLFLRFALDMPINQALWFGFFHSISAFNNAGFSIFETGLVAYRGDFWINFVITSLVIIGGIGYFVLLELYLFQRKRLSSLSVHTKIVLISTLVLILSATLAVFCFEYANIKSLGALSFFDKLLSSYFTAVNYRTSGFNTLDLSTFKDASLFFGSLFMIIGGGPGGTSGGIKVTTFAVLIIYTYWVIKNGRVRVFHYEIPDEVVKRAFVIAVGSAAYIVICVLLLSLLEGEVRFIYLLFETSSAFATVGVSVGDGGTLSLSALFGDSAKLIIIVMMISGRIGIFAFLVAIFTKDKEKYIKYPEGKIYL